MLSQKFADFEALCICDASNDGSVDIVKEFCHLDDRFRFLSGMSRGLSAARNIGLEAASGRYICFLDSDDYYAKNALHTLYQEIVGLNPDILVFGASAIPRRPCPQRWLKRTLSAKNAAYDLGGIRCLFENQSAMPFVWRNCYQHAFLDQHAIRFDDALRVAEDVAFQMDTFCRAKRIRFISSKLYFYQWYRENSLQHQYSQNAYKRLLGHLQVVDHVLSQWTELDILNENRFSLAAWVLGFLFGYDLRNLPLQQRLEVEHQTLKRIYALLDEEELTKLPFFSRAQFTAIANDDFSLDGFIGKVRYHVSKLCVKKEW